MNRLSRWLQDRRWAANMVRARRWRRRLKSRKQREVFDRALVAPNKTIYDVTVQDVCDAMWASSMIGIAEGRDPT